MSTPISDREREVLIEIARGATCAGAGATLGITRETVKSHLRTIARKLGTHSATHAVAVAMAHDWIIAQDVEPLPVGGTR